MSSISNDLPAWFLALTPEAAADAVRSSQKPPTQQSLPVAAHAEHQTPSNKPEEHVVAPLHSEPQVVEVHSAPVVVAVEVQQQPSIAKVVVAADDKKRKKPEWECPVCTEGLYSTGMVPCAIRGCQHMICKKCGDSLMKSTRACPCCRNHMMHLSPLLDLIDKDDRVAMTLLTGLKGERIYDAELVRRIEALDICQDNAIKERLTFVARGALEKVYNFGSRKARSVSWAYVPEFDVKRITLKVEDSRKIMGIVNPNREKLRYALHQKALLIENGLNEVFAPDFHFTATEQTNEKGTFQNYMCFKITKKL